MGTRDFQEDQFIHLVRLKWELRTLDLSVIVDLSMDQEPKMLVRRAMGPLKIMASRRGTDWFFIWGRSQDQRVRALDAGALRHIWDMAQ